MLSASQRTFAKRIIHSFDVNKVAKDCKLNVNKITEHLADPESELYKEVQKQIERRKVVNEFFGTETLLNELIQIFMDVETVAKDRLTAANIIIKLMSPESDSSEKVAKVLEALLD